MSLQGVMGGFIDVATTAWILNIWQDKSNPYMQGNRRSTSPHSSLSLRLHHFLQVYTSPMELE